jgi:HD-GYP domain-containing protein (c-di-GMP phosphodiesterase class II)
MNSKPTSPGPELLQTESALELRFLLALHMLINSARIHQDNNRTLLSSVEQFIAIIRQLFEEEDEVGLLTSAGRFYLRQEKLVYRANIAGIAGAMLNLFEQRKLNGLRFFPAIMDAPAADIASFARILIKAENQENPSGWLATELNETRFSWVEPVPASDERLQELTADATQPDRENGKPREKTGSTRERGKKEQAIMTYGYAVLSLRDIAHKVSANRKSGIKKALRMVHKMIDMVTEDSNVLLGLSTIRDYDDYTYTHSMNVAILSLCLGQKIGLARKSLETLTLSALFHDLGKIDVPKNILNKPGKLSDLEFKEMKNHSLYSVRRILLLKTSPQKKAEMLLGPFEHHLKYDLSGYPRTPRNKPISLFGRIIAIADVYDAITAPRVYRPFAISPDRSLSIMLEGAGKDFDPILLKVFINMIGVYPIGTVLTFAEGKIGLVAKYSGEEGKNKDLWVQLLTPLPEGKFAKGELINLGPIDAERKTFNQPILGSTHPAAYNIQPADFLL